MEKRKSKPILAIIYCPNRACGAKIPLYELPTPGEGEIIPKLPIEIECPKCHDMITIQWTISGD